MCKPNPNSTEGKNIFIADIVVQVSKHIMEYFFSSLDIAFEQYRYLLLPIKCHLMQVFLPELMRGHQVALCRFSSFWCHLAGYHQQWFTSRDRMKVWLSADRWQDMQLLSKWSILQRKTAVSMPQRDVVTFFFSLVK